MSTSDMRRPVLVGVDGSADALRAARYAADEARLWGAGVRLVHAVHETVPMTPMFPLFSSETLHGAADRVMADAASEVDRRSDGEVPTETLVQTGPAVRTLVDSAADARMIVLGHRTPTGLGRLAAGSTSAGVAAHAQCPVVSVPREWESASTHGLVVAGVDGSSASREVLGEAFSAAAVRGASLRVLHAWRPPSPYDDIVESQTTADEWLAGSKPVLSEILAGWGQDFPDVPVEVDLRFERTVDALVDASSSADLLVVGRHGHGGLLGGLTGLLFGSVARAMLRHAHCPVEVAPHRDELHGQHDVALAKSS